MSKNDVKETNEKELQDPIDVTVDPVDEEIEKEKENLKKKSVWAKIKSAPLWVKAALIAGGALAAAAIVWVAKKCFGGNFEAAQMFLEGTDNALLETELESSIGAETLVSDIVE